MQEPVGEREAQPRGRFRVHVDDAPLAVRAADQVGGEEIDEVRARLRVAAGMQEGGIAEYEPRRNFARFEQLLRAVKVLDDQVEQLCPLDHAAFEMRPFAGGQDDRE